MICWYPKIDFWYPQIVFLVSKNYFVVSNIDCLVSKHRFIVEFVFYSNYETLDSIQLGHPPSLAWFHSCFHCINLQECSAFLLPAREEKNATFQNPCASIIHHCIIRCQRTCVHRNSKIALQCLRRSAHI